MFRWKVVLPTVVIVFLIVLSFQQAFGALQEPYVNEEYGFLISPPQGWTVQEESEGDILVYFMGPIDEGFRINSNILVKETQESLQDYVDRQRDGLLNDLGVSIILEGSRIINGHEAYEIVFTWTYQTIDLQSKQVWLVEKGNGYIIAFSALQTNYDSYITDFDESVDTFEFPVQRVVGVAAGDWIKFGGIDVTWNSNDPNASKVWYGMDLEMYNQTEWVMMEFTQVSGTNVTVQSVQHFKNCTEETSGGWIDVDTGDGVNATSMLISANLNEDDAMYTSGDYSKWFINETNIRTYPDGARETNHINFTYAYNYTIPPDTNVDYFYSMNFYWDRVTGILVEDSFEMRNQTGAYLTTWSMNFKITQSNIWVIPEFPTLLAWLAIAIATLLVIITKQKLLRLSRSTLTRSK